MLDSLSSLMRAMPLLLQGAVITLELAFCAIAIGLIGGVVVGVLNCRQLRLASTGMVLNACVCVLRGTPLFVQVLIVYYAVPEVLGVSFSPFTAGVIACGVNSMAYISEIVRGGINAIPDGQWEAAYVIGLKPWQTVQGVILPQMFRITLPSVTNELMALVKETSILMIIGVAELTKVSKDIVARELDPMTIYLGTAAIYLVMTGAISLMTLFVTKRWQS